MIKTSQDRQPGLGTTGISGTLTISKTGTTARTVTFPDAAITVAGIGLAQTWTALQTHSAGLTVSSGTTALQAITGTTLTASGTITGNGANGLICQYGSVGNAFLAIVTGDASARFVFDHNGGMAWGSGAGARDTTLVRAAAGVLSTGGSFAVGTSAPLASERLRVAGGTMGTPGATDVLLAGGKVYAGSTTGATSGSTGSIISAGGIAANASSYFLSISSSYACQFINTNAGTAPGLYISAGRTTDLALAVEDAAGAALMRLNGNGLLTINKTGGGISVLDTSATSIQTAGGITAGGNLSVLGNTTLTGALHMAGVSTINEIEYQSTFAWNAYYSGGWKYRAASSAMRINSGAIQCAATGAADAALTWTNAVGIDASTTAGQTRLLIYDVDNGTLERVTVGAADSGGVGFKLLRIPN